MCIYLYTYDYIYIYVYAHAHTHIYLCMHIDIHLYTLIYIYMSEGPAEGSAQGFCRRAMQLQCEKHLALSRVGPLCRTLKLAVVQSPCAGPCCASPYAGPAHSCSHIGSNQ